MDAMITEPTRSTARQRELVDRRRRVSIRPIEPSDASSLSDFYAALSPRSRHQRFLGPGGLPPPEQIAKLSRAAGIVGVLNEPGPRDGEIVAHASIHPDGRGAAEVAFAVADELQGQGVGSRLMAATVALALRVGVHRLSANLYVDNLPMRRLLVDAGRALVSDTLEAGTEEITLDLDRAA